eukprot:symbB.v1.2.035839.t1/scaffold4920.1/size32872/1
MAPKKGGYGSKQPSRASSSTIVIPQWLIDLANADEQGILQILENTNVEQLIEHETVIQNVASELQLRLALMREKTGEFKASKKQQERAVATKEREIARKENTKKKTAEKNSKTYVLRLLYNGQEFQIRVKGRATLRTIRMAFRAEIGLSEVAAKRLLYTFNGVLMNPFARREITGDWKMKDGDLIEVRNPDDINNDDDGEDDEESEEEERDDDQVEQ